MNGLRNRVRTDFIVIHASLTKKNSNLSYPYLDRKHRDQGAYNCGYHFVIDRDGVTIQGRPMDQVGNHCPGVNAASISVCLMGGISDEGGPENNFTPNQFSTLKLLLNTLQKKYPEAAIVGHRDVSIKSVECPCFDVSAWVSQGDTEIISNSVRETNQ